MIRFIFKHKYKDAVNGYENDGFTTLDVNCKPVESMLLKGGFSEDGYERFTVVGAEIVSDLVPSIDDEACL